MVKLIGLVGTNPKNQQTVNYYNTFKNIFQNRRKLNLSKLKTFQCSTNQLQKVVPQEAQAIAEKNRCSRWSYH